MPIYTIIRSDGQHLTTVSAPTESAALDEYAKLAGFDDWQHAQIEAPQPPGSILVQKAPESARLAVQNYQTRDQ